MVNANSLAVEPFFNNRASGSICPCLLVNFVSSSNTSGLISLEWNYDDILVKDDNNLERFFNTTTSLKERMLPFIDKIHVDI